MAAENGYSSQPAYQLYDTTGATEDWTYYATGGLGFTFEIGCTVETPDGGCSDGYFHPSYAKTIAEYEGRTDRSDPPGHDGHGNREAYYKALESTATRPSTPSSRAPRRPGRRCGCTRSSTPRPHPCSTRPASRARCSSSTTRLTPPCRCRRRASSAGTSTSRPAPSSPSTRAACRPAPSATRSPSPAPRVPRRRRARTSTRPTRTAQKRHPSATPARRRSRQRQGRDHGHLGVVDERLGREGLEGHQWRRLLDQRAGGRRTARGHLRRGVQRREDHDRQPPARRQVRHPHAELPRHRSLRRDGRVQGPRPVRPGPGRELETDV